MWNQNQSLVRSHAHIQIDSSALITHRILVSFCSLQPSSKTCIKGTPTHLRPPSNLPPTNTHTHTTTTTTTTHNHHRHPLPFTTVTYYHYPYPYPYPYNHNHNPAMYHPTYATYTPAYHPGYEYAQPTPAPPILRSPSFNAASSHYSSARSSRRVSFADEVRPRRRRSSTPGPRSVSFSSVEDARPTRTHSHHHNNTHRNRKNASAERRAEEEFLHADRKKAERRERDEQRRRAEEERRRADKQQRKEAAKRAAKKAAEKEEKRKRRARREKENEIVSVHRHGRKSSSNHPLQNYETEHGETRRKHHSSKRKQRTAYY